MYAQVKELLHWEELARITKSLITNLTSRKIIMDQGAWSDEEQTIAWERYMQTEGLSQHVSCQHCKGMEKPIAVVVPGKDQQRRKLTCFCTDCWSFSSIRHNKTTSMDVSFFKQFNPETGKFHRALQGGFEGRSQTMNRITSEKLGSSLGRRADQTRRPMSYIDH